MNFIIKRILKIILVISQYSPFALVWMVKAFLIDWPIKKWSLFKFPNKAKEMGLHYIKSDYIKEFGFIKGKIDGYIIEIKPDESMNSSIRVTTLNKDSKLEISLDKSALRPKNNICEFKTTDWKFNWTFKTKRTHVDSINIITNQNDLFDSLLEFYTRWIFNLDALFIDNGEVFCRFKYGFYFFPYIPVYRIQQMVNQLITIAKNHDEIFSK
jgi:hypothetical protein